MKSNILGNNIRKLREKYELTQIEFAKILNISNTTLSQYESGNRIPNDEIKLMIADYFKVSLDYLLGREINNFDSLSIEEEKKKRTSNNEKNVILDDIESLSPESKKELEKYIQLLKLKDTIDKSKGEMSSHLTQNVSEGK
ncbi:helix-turn-helix domain-containing protein [Ruminiclostridium cellobioparum]|uniref:Helix-turn-helix protein n=1 Tax=Ruminiclostridium cellobioparum subsp. termitidis CT1112 TaxID=1195236 RepID=S0FKJ1_RUMCE|nr:helix-turn-helix transcriptional regulator [Ruminiclostridium cellobioparum]EMS72347.1 helix-turn-helix protein [Ruminiclostridium cellobioparum subsp. termitidis CT1112]